MFYSVETLSSATDGAAIWHVALLTGREGSSPGPRLRTHPGAGTRIRLEDRVVTPVTSPASQPAAVRVPSYAGRRP